ncbi:MAG TPA: NADH-quinone oxidoreductase subunit C [Actinomycetota bacterium]|nr:NADH-quinone oxidoreductase subunit C [Actinomycetota bacterium]
MRPSELADRLRGRFPDVLLARDEVTLFVEATDLPGTLAALRDDDDLALGFLSGVTATHHPGRVPEFWVVYDLRSVEHAHRLRVKVGVGGPEPHVPSLVAAFPTANWHERETFDLFGVVFDGHPDLDRILLPDDWEGHPLRKDEELGGVGTRFRGASIPPVDERTMP